jgi:ABC-type transporter Mla MlaB component
MEKTNKSSQVYMKDGILCLKGEVTLEFVSIFYEKGCKALLDEPEMVIDLSGVEKFDHALPALLLTWRAQAKRLGKFFCLKRLSKDMIMLARLSGVDEILLDCGFH